MRERRSLLCVCVLCRVCVIITNYPGSNMRREIIHFIYINCNTNFHLLRNIWVPLVQLRIPRWHMYIFKLQKRPPNLFI
jgi:hypothetical protein